MARIRSHSILGFICPWFEIPNDLRLKDSWRTNSQTFDSKLRVGAIVAEVAEVIAGLHEPIVLIANGQWHRRRPGIGWDHAGEDLFPCRVVLHYQEIVRGARRGRPREDWLSEKGRALRRQRHRLVESDSAVRSRCQKEIFQKVLKDARPYGHKVR